MEVQDIFCQVYTYACHRIRRKSIVGKVLRFAIRKLACIIIPYYFKYSKTNGYERK